MIDHVLQAAILIASAGAMFLITLPSAHALQPWGYVVGLSAQPLWFIATWRARQWGFFALAVFYTGMWVAGIHNHFPGGIT